MPHPLSRLAKASPWIAAPSIAQARIGGSPSPSKSIRRSYAVVKAGRRVALAFGLLFPYTINMKKSISVHKKGPGRPATGQDPLVSARLPEPTLAAVEKWAKRSACSRSEAIRRLVEAGLKAKPTVPLYTKKAATKAAKIAERISTRLSSRRRLSKSGTAARKGCSKVPRSSATSELIFQSQGRDEHYGGPFLQLPASGIPKTPESKAQAR